MCIRDSVNTDCAVCTFPNNAFPFLVNDLGNIEGYYHDENIYKYRLEAKSERITTQALPQWIRKQTYEYSKPEWHTVQDSGDNDFMPMVHKILDSNKSINIEGRAGTGKSTFIKQLHEEMDKRKIKYISLAPTNKACRIIKGKTIDKFIASFTLSNFKKHEYKYIFIDEISMVREVFYKFFIYLKRAYPKIKFIIAGDFAQLLPVKDRLGDKSYKNCIALHELCDGQKLS